MSPLRTGASLSRRTFLATAAATGAGLTIGNGPARARAAPQSSTRPICAFVKFIQPLPFDQMAGTLAEIGFDGIEATVRPGGQIEPERAPDELPKLVEALKAHGLELTIMTTGINRADQPHAETVLRAAKASGVTLYRMDQYRYDLSKPIAGQLEGLRTAVRSLADLNREIGIGAVYQNHAGARYVGASVWDIHDLLDPMPIARIQYDPIPESAIGIAFDIRHATVEAGLSWPALWNLVESRARAVFVKDFRWEGRKVENVPLGNGQVDPAFFGLMDRSGFRGPISLHVEYLEKAGVAENVAALREDLKTLRRLIGAA